jgi:flavin reductase (DIM6/NTAB) family NADH-FMN oxidoreductase RutF
VNPSGQDVNPEALRIAMRYWATGVTIVSSLFNDVRHGMTVSSFTSVSLIPPLVLVALEKISRTHQLVEQSGVFGVTILRENQQDISDRFAGRHTEYEDRFEGINTHTLITGAPLVAGGLAYFDCQVVTTYNGGSHTLFIGSVVASLADGLYGQPLVYFDRAYRQLISDNGGNVV